MQFCVPSLFGSWGRHLMAAPHHVCLGLPLVLFARSLWSRSGLVMFLRSFPDFLILQDGLDESFHIFGLDFVLCIKMWFIIDWTLLDICAYYTGLHTERLDMDLYIFLIVIVEYGFVWEGEGVGGGAVKLDSCCVPFLGCWRGRSLNLTTGKGFGTFSLLWVEMRRSNVIPRSRALRVQVLLGVFLFAALLMGVSLGLMLWDNLLMFFGADFGCLLDW